MSQPLDKSRASGEILADTPPGEPENKGPKKGNAARPSVMAGMGHAARNRGTMVHGSHERASLSCCATPLAAERAVLGALITGALGLRDVAGASEWFGLGMGQVLHRKLFAVLVAALEVRASGGYVPGRRGLDLVWLLGVCRASGVWPAGASFHGAGARVVSVGYVPTVAREAPRRQAALDACADLAREALRLWDVHQDAAVLQLALDEHLEAEAAAFILEVRRRGGLPIREGGVRPLEPEALALASYTGTRASEALRGAA